MKKVIFLLSFAVICFSSFAISSPAVDKPIKEKVVRKMKVKIPMAVEQCGFTSVAEAQAAGELWKNTHAVPRSATVTTAVYNGGHGNYIYCYYVYWNVVII